MLGRQPRSSSACRNHVADVERLPERYDSAKFDFYEPEDVLAIVRELERPTVAEGDEQTALPAASAQDAAIVLIAAFAGLRMGEVLALRVRDIDFTAEAIRVMGSIDHVEGVGPTKGGRGRSVPMVPEVAQALARILSRDDFTGADDLVFPNSIGEPIDNSALRRRYKAAQKRAALRPLRFHDLRHTFGSLAAAPGAIAVRHLATEFDELATFRHLDEDTLCAQFY